MLYFRYEKHQTQKRNKQKVTCSLPKLNDLPVFEPHHPSNCSVCRYQRKQWTSPRKGPPPEEESGNKESTPKRQVTSHVTRSLLHSLSPVSTSQSLLNTSVLESSGLSGKSISTPNSPQNSTSIPLDCAVAGPSNLSNSYVSDSNLTKGKIVEDTLLEEKEVSVPEITSLSTDRFIEKGIAEQIKCTICLGVPLSPTVTPCCEHFNCKECIIAWLETSETCTNCRASITLKDISEVTGFKENVYDILHVKCRYIDSGRTVTPTAKNLNEHEQNCVFKNMRVKQVRGKGKKKMSLSQVKNRQSCKNGRLKDFFDFFETKCAENHENKTDVLFFMLRNELWNSGQKDAANEIQNIWTNKNETSLTVDQSLAMRVDLLMTKSQYRKQYGLFEQNLANNVLKPPSQLDEAEKHYLPGSTEFQITDVNGSILHHQPTEGSTAPVNILSSFYDSVPESPTPNIKGVRWNYAKALAQSLVEIDPNLEKSLQNIKQSPDDNIINTIVKDGADGLGEVSVHKEKGDRFLPDKAFRFSFALISSKCATATPGEVKTIFETKNPNSVRTNRPLLECICDENSHASIAASLLPIEQEREYLKD